MARRTYSAASRPALRQGQQGGRNRARWMRNGRIVGVVECLRGRAHRVDESGVQRVQLFAATDDGGFLRTVELAEALLSWLKHYPTLWTKLSV